MSNTSRSRSPDQGSPGQGKPAKPLVIELQAKSPPEAAPDAKASSARVFDFDSAEPVQKDGEATWGEFRERLVIILSKVMGDAQARRLIDRIAGGANVSDDAVVSGEELSEVGSRVLAKVPNRKVRSTLEIELKELISNL